MRKIRVYKKSKQCQDCGQPVRASKRCHDCYMKWLNSGPSKKSQFRNAEEHANWKGGCIIQSGNTFYKIIKMNGETIKEHRLIMEKHLGRKLKKDEHIHHKNGDGLDNRIENLEILSHSEHRFRHRKERHIIECPCGEMVEIKPSLLKIRKYCSKSCLYKYSTTMGRRKKCNV